MKLTTEEAGGTIEKREQEFAGMQNEISTQSASSLPYFDLKALAKQNQHCLHARIG